MAIPTHFKEANMTWKGYDDVEDLPAFRDEVEGVSVSCWKLTWCERVKALFTGRVWLQVWGTHPPVNVGGSSPFIKPKDVEGVE